ncbi:hypothetical protein P3719_18525 [Vibrio parahaemolyticus]|uniref:Uncharacterized protein n=2 Tax=Vibrio harveyi group TaxID=717610 RepID=A0AA47JMX4_VIBPH|nr:MULTISPECIES: hypothetical protein [Vibrio]EJG1066144.1 hypothetical protein [Vibrio parahaemolyticus O1]MDW1807466.1 hypothetical protein [Vibrio sp. Vb2362]MDW2296376.1 hypothetical protein [Vibrio sp. 1404]APX09831.1 hypothetical protein BWP24_26835 [Vibrio campbellii]ARR10202.1 hypothetical protein Vc3S01_p20087 [Vibrio campbellii]
MFKYLPIAAFQAESLPETNAIATTPDKTEYYLDIAAAKELSVYDQLVDIEPEIATLAESGTEVINLSVY